MTISDTSLRSSVWLTVYNLVGSITFTTSVSPTVTGAFIDDEHASFPQIVIYPTEVERSNYMIGSDRTYHQKTINITIEIYTKKNKDIDTISDELDAAMLVDIDGLTLTDTNEIKGEVFPNDQKIHMKTITYTFIRR